MGARAEFQRCLDAHCEFTYEFRVRRFDGQYRWMISRGSPRFSKKSDFPGYAGSLTDITERKEAEEQLRALNSAVLSLSARLITVQEEERTRIARELHDNLSQKVASIGIALSNIKRGIPDDLCETREQVERTYRRLLEVSEGVRNLSHELHPAILEHAGLVATLESYCTEFEALAHVSAKVHADGRFGDLPTNVQLGIYRITQEALQNIWKQLGCSLHFRTLCNR